MRMDEPGRATTTRRMNGEGDDKDGCVVASNDEDGQVRGATTLQRMDALRQATTRKDRSGRRATTTRMMDKWGCATTRMDKWGRATAMRRMDGPRRATIRSFIMG